MIIFNNLKKLLNSLPEEKAFYAGVSFIIFIISFLLSLIIFLNSKAIEIPKYSESVTIGSAGKVQFLLPIYANTDVEKSLSSLIFSGLTKKQFDGSFVNDLAESVDFDETNTIISIKIKDEAKFHNGESITSDDAMFTFALLENPTVEAVDKVLYEGISFEKVDDKNFTIMLKKPYPRLLEALSVGILSKKDFENVNLSDLTISEKNLNTIYSGRYYLDEIISESGYKNFVLKTNFSNNNKKPYIKNINFKVYDTENAIYNDFKSKKLDLVLNPNQEILKDEYYKNNFATNNFVLPRITSLYLNPNKKESLASKEVRQALYYAINRDEMVRDLDDLSIVNYFILPHSPFEGSSPLTNEEIQSIFDKKLKSDIITVLVSQNEKRQKVAEFVKTTLENFGLQVEIKVIDSTELANNTIKNRDFEILLYSSEISSVYDMYAFLHSSLKNAPGLNITNYLSKNLDENLEAIKNSTNTNTLDLAISNIKEEFYKEYPYIPLYTPTQNLIYKKNINLNMPKQINSYKDIFMNTENWSSETEKTYQNFYKENLINKIYSIIH